MMTHVVNAAAAASVFLAAATTAGQTQTPPPATTPPPNSGTPATTPPPGTPAAAPAPRIVEPERIGLPEGPLQRTSSRNIRMRFELLMTGANPNDPVRELRRDTYPRLYINEPVAERLIFQEATMLLPVAIAGPFHEFALERFVMRLQGDGKWVHDGPIQIDENLLPGGTRSIRSELPSFDGTQFRWTVEGSATVWDVRMDDRAAAQLPWPDQWPEEVADMLKPSLFIDSENVQLNEVVSRLFDGNVLSVPPYVAAKRTVAMVLTELRVTGPSLRRGVGNAITGVVVTGTDSAVAEQIGSPVDLVTTSVAALRAAGIPARPVIGVREETFEEDDDDDTIPAVWAEFYLAGAGWVPFDPIAMKGEGNWRSAPMEFRWDGFGNIEDFDHRVPLAYDFAPAPGFEPAQRIAIYGWKTNPSPPLGGFPAQFINVELFSEGRLPPR